MSELAPDAVVWDFLRGGLMTKALGVAADLGIAERLADGPRTVDELAAESGANADALHRILRALASDGVFAEEDGGAFRNTETSELLRRSDWSAFAHHFASVFYEAALDLEEAGSTGAATFPGRFGDDFWPWLAAHPEERRLFDAAMAGGKSRSAERLAALEWREGETVVDAGGGNGALLRELLARRPELRGIVFDLPETHRDEAALGDRIEFVAGSFFERVPEGDAYVLSGILHDWDDEQAGTILRNIRAAAAAGARVLILESVVPPGNEPSGAKWLDLLMLVLAGGRERTESEWHALLEGAGMQVESVEDRLVQARCR
jgi:O-methyltransferase